MLKILAAACALTMIAGVASAQTKPPAAKPVAAEKAPMAAPEDKYVGYYYPKPSTIETFESSLQPIANVDRAQRIQFVTVMSQGTIQSNYRVPYAVFAKGDKGDRLIVVGMQGGELNTLYRMRALLANMTTQARLSPFFQERTVAEDATFFDLLKMLGFATLTITDGEKLTHQVTIK